jgi:hypothetical protein
MVLTRVGRRIRPEKRCWRSTAMSKDAWKRFGDEGYKHYSVVECGFSTT